MAYVAFTKAALGEDVPAKPPLSFQATRASAPPLSLTKIPRSWLNPALPVQRSELAPSTAVESAPGLRMVLRLGSSMGCQVVPLELLSEYWDVSGDLTKLGTVPVGKTSATSDVGEWLPGSPALAAMNVPGAFLLVFHLSLKT